VIVPQSVPAPQPVHACADFLHALEVLAQRVRSKGFQASVDPSVRDAGMVKVYTMSGQTPPKDRSRLVAEFNNHRGPAVFLLTIKACGIGINLTSATRAILANPQYNPMWEAQAAARCHRIGQSQPVVIYRLAFDGAFDQKIRVRTLCRWYACRVHSFSRW
jgi:superfamily II DNA or RNA helicase